MPRQAGIRYYESSEDEDYEYSRSNDRQRHGEPELEKQIVRESAAEAARSRNEEMLRDDAISSVRRPRSRIRTTASRSRELTRARESYSSDEGSGEDDEHVKQHRVEGGKVQQVGGHNRPSHSKASKLRRQGPRSLSDVCNKDTISKDNTVGNQAQMDELLASFGKKSQFTNVNIAQRPLTQGRKKANTGHTFGLLIQAEGDAKPGRNTLKKKTAISGEGRDRSKNDSSHSDFSDESDGFGE
ncbi:hypothetical protein ACHAP5_007047 [Fusarium lateritium]